MFDRTCLCLPTFNEAQNVEAVVTDIRKVFDGLLFAVDGFSTDRTVDVLKSLNVDVYQRTNPGKGSALQKALQVAEDNEKEFLIYFDCDQTYTPANIHRFCSLLDKADLIIGVRPLGLINPYHRRLGNLVATGLINVTGNGKIKDSLSGLKCLRVSKFKPLLKEDGFVIDALICVLALHLKMNTYHVQVNFNERTGKSKMGLLIGLRELWKLIIHIATLKVRKTH
ncbi:MAG: hypothetical protein RL266_245 [Bacteroidota bacterium]|jgi:dolichol-phosphate mannosyltransferase